jgi:hypothetical protein
VAARGHSSPVKSDSQRTKVRIGQAVSVPSFDTSVNTRLQQPQNLLTLDQHRCTFPLKHQQARPAMTPRGRLSGGRLSNHAAQLVSAVHWPHSLSAACCA